MTRKRTIRNSIRHLNSFLLARWPDVWETRAHLWVPGLCLFQLMLYAILRFGYPVALLGPPAPEVHFLSVFGISALVAFIWTIRTSIWCDHRRITCGFSGWRGFLSGATVLALIMATPVVYAAALASRIHHAKPKAVAIRELLESEVAWHAYNSVCTTPGDRDRSNIARPEEERKNVYSEMPKSLWQDARLAYPSLNALRVEEATRYVGIEALYLQQPSSTVKDQVDLGKTLITCSIQELAAIYREVLGVRVEVRAYWDFEMPELGGGEKRLDARRRYVLFGHTFTKKVVLYVDPATYEALEQRGRPGNSKQYVDLHVQFAYRWQLWWGVCAIAMTALFATNSTHRPASALSLLGITLSGFLISLWRIGSDPRFDSLGLLTIPLFLGSCGAIGLALLRRRTGMIVDLAAPIALCCAPLLPFDLIIFSIRAEVDDSLCRYSFTYLAVVSAFFPVQNYFANRLHALPR